MKHVPLSGQSGQGLVSVLVGIALMGIVLAALTTMMSSQWRETRALGEKLAALDLQQLLTASLANGSVCQYVLNNPTVLTFDSTNLPATITLPSPDANGSAAALYRAVLANPAPPPVTIPGPIAAQVGQPASASSQSLVVTSIQLRISNGSGGAFAANWLVNFDSSKLIRAIQPVSVSTTLIADTTAPAAAKILACSSPTRSLGCVAGSVRAQTGSTSILTADGYVPVSFGDVFFTFTSDPLDWGIGCKAGWHLTGCSLLNANTSGDSAWVDWDLQMKTKGGLPACASDNDEYNSDGAINAMCCKIM